MIARLRPPVLPLHRAAPLPGYVPGSNACLETLLAHVTKQVMSLTAEHSLCQACELWLLLRTQTHTRPEQGQLSSLITDVAECASSVSVVDPQLSLLQDAVFQGRLNPILHVVVSGRC